MYDMIANKRRAFAGAIFRMLDAALPFQYRPTVIIILRQLAENALEIDLAITERAETPRPIDPILIATINARTAARIELRILDVEHLDAFVVDIDIA